MGSLPSADLTPVYPGVTPLGLGTGAVDSFTGYVVRLDNAFDVPAAVLLTHSLNAVLPPTRRDLHYRRNEALNDADPAVLHVADGIARLTGERDVQRLSFLGLVDLFHLVDRDLVSQTRQWCPLCWADDPEPMTVRSGGSPWSTPARCMVACWSRDAIRAGPSAIPDPRCVLGRLLVLRQRLGRVLAGYLLP